MLSKQHDISGWLRQFSARFSLWTPVLIFLCLIVTAIVSYQAIGKLVQDNNLVTHTHEVLKEVMGVMLALNAAESGQRGYIITEDQSFLEAYQAAVKHVRQRLTTLKTLTTDNALQQVEINRFEKLVSRRLSIFETVLRQNGSGFGGMRDALINIGGQQAMAAAAAQAEKIAEVERELLSKRTFASWGSEGFARMSFGIGLTFTLGVVAFSYYLLFIDFFNRKNAADRLRMAHDNLELRVAERTKELERSNRELQDFAFIASHDLQEPLRKIQLFGDRLRSKYSLLLDATGQDYLARMQNAATRMNRLIADLLMFSRLSSQQRPLEMVDLNSICRDVLSDLEASIDHYEGTVQCHPLPSVMADAMQMRQLLQNLLSNALKFHRPDVKPEVSIRWLNQEAFQADTSSETGPRESNEYRIAITDNGIGIEDQHIAKIFAPFQRLHGAGNEYEGTGIGLAVCTKIVERHHGNIQVLSTPGQGSTFVVALPVSPHTK